MGAISTLWATPTPTPNVVPISDGSATLQAWVTSGSGGIDLQTALDALSTTQGAIIFRGASAWQALEPSEFDAVLTSHGPGADPTWDIGPGASIFNAWVAAVDAAGGTYESDSKTICLALANRLVAASYYPRLVYLLPFLGADMIAARVPLIDTLAAGIATNGGFVNGNFDQTTGVQGTGSAYLDSNIKPSQLGTSNNGGIGLGVRTVGSGIWTMGARTASQIYGLALYSQELGYWGDSTGQFQSGAAPTAQHYNWQRSSPTNRTLYGNGTVIGSNTASGVPVTQIANSNIFIFAISSAGGSDCCDHQLNFAYMTDGTMTATEIADFHTLLQTYLITPTGR